MPFTNCLGCEIQKRSKNDLFYSVNTIPNPLITINNLRQKYNTRKRKLTVIDEITGSSKICKSCYTIAKENLVVSSDHTLPDLSFYREGRNSHVQCTFGCRQVGTLVSVPKHLRRSLLMEYKFLVLPDARICSDHFDTANYWPLVKQIGKEVDAEKQKLVSDLMYDYYHQSSRSDMPIFDFNKMNSINDSDFHAWFGYDKLQFNKICEFSKSKPQQVAILLCKLRTSLSNEQLGFLFGCCERTISNHLDTAIRDLIENLVPKFINNNSRATLINHNTQMAKILFNIPNDNAAFIFDATYRFTQKSKNYAGQKQMWSEQKKMPLIKPMVGCAPDGYVYFVLGPYDATHNDAVILQDCFERYENLLSTIQEGDFVFVDRGFRDVMQFLRESKKVKAYCPGTGDLDTFECNLTRFVTKIRWVVEQVFGRLKKKFKIFAIPAHNATLVKDYDSLLIAFALLNLFHEPILPDEGDENVANLMLSRLMLPNNLKKVVETYNLTQVRTPYIELNYTDIDNEENNRLLQFPELTLDDLYNVSLGGYQITNAKSYFAQHQKENIFLVHKFEPNARHPTAALNYKDHGIVIENPLLVKGYMKSRYRSGKYHHIFVLIDKSKSGAECITEYYCSCASGSRTVGCCSHVMTIIWYLGYGQYQLVDIPNPGICDVSITIPKKSN